MTPCGSWSEQRKFPAGGAVVTGDRDEELRDREGWIA